MTFFSKELFTIGSNNVFVFGSNLAGVHGAGAARFAVDYCGAIYGQGYGMQGNSFAIPTKDENIESLPIPAIESFVRQFLYFAEQNPQLAFYVTAIGTGLAGYTDLQIAPMFANASANCVLPDKWQVSDNKGLKLVE
jgi:Na+-driven multidrug efflux pump